MYNLCFKTLSNNKLITFNDVLRYCLDFNNCYHIEIEYGENQIMNYYLSANQYKLVYKNGNKVIKNEY